MVHGTLGIQTWIFTRNQQHWCAADVGAFDRPRTAFVGVYEHLISKRSWTAVSSFATCERGSLLLASQGEELHPVW